MWREGEWGGEADRWMEVKGRKEREKEGEREKFEAWDRWLDGQME